MKKSKKILSGVMAVCLMGSMAVIPESIAPAVSITANAEYEAEYTMGTYEQLSYMNFGDHIEISDCDYGVTDVVIPAEIEGLPVTSIGYQAFMDCENLTSVIIPDSVKSIGVNAFWYCSNLTDITIPNSITYIGLDAFYGTKWLKEREKENPLVIVNNILIDGSTCEGDIVIPDGVINIGEGAFSFCSNLESIVIPDNILEIPGHIISYSGCKSITVLNPECSIDDMAFFIIEGGAGLCYVNTIRGYENSTAQAYAEKYGCTFESFGEAPALPLGNINNDEYIDAIDATAILVEYAELSTSGVTTFSYAQKKSADVNSDGFVDAVDATLILNYYAKISTGNTITLPDFIAENN